MNRRQRKRNKALKGKQIVHEDELAPGIAAGLTQGVPAEEALSYFKVKGISGVDLVKHMRDADQRLDRHRDHYAAFVAAENADAVIVDEATGRVFHDVSKTYTPAGFRMLQEGRQCLRCDEPQDFPFPEMCDVCGYPMRERQIMDIAMEFEGHKHLGPSKPISEYQDELDLRTEKRRFIDRVLEGGQGRIPKDWLRDAHLFPNGVPEQLQR